MIEELVSVWVCVARYASCTVATKRRKYAGPATSMLYGTSLLF